MLATAICLSVLLVTMAPFFCLNPHPVLQGYMYLTNSYLCFFAHMPSREVSIFPTNRDFLTWPLQNQVLKSGSLNKKAQRTKRWIKHWFVLKNDALSWYQSSSVRDGLSAH
jgi:sterol 3beta-glucosyltransferase